jgi:hypothetical protein
MVDNKLSGGAAVLSKYLGNALCRDVNRSFCSGGAFA